MGKSRKSGSRKSKKGSFSGGARRLSKHADTPKRKSRKSLKGSRKSRKGSRKSRK